MTTWLSTRNPAQQPALTGRKALQQSRVGKVPVQVKKLRMNSMQPGMPLLGPHPFSLFSTTLYQCIVQAFPFSVGVFWFMEMGLGTIL
ncbi:hypothetical protein AMTRI_Chr11g153970 [Amborella trichopoda]